MDQTIEQKHLHDLVNDFHITMLVTHNAKSIHSRPMIIAHLDEAMVAYLITDAHSVKIDEINSNPYGLLTFQSSSRYASISGHVAVLADRTMISLMWKETWQVWFPKGKTDPNITLLKFTVSEGEYWDNGGVHGLKFAYSAAKAYVSGETPELGPDIHAKVSF